MGVLGGVHSKPPFKQVYKTILYEKVGGEGNSGVKRRETRVE